MEGLYNHGENAYVRKSKMKSDFDFGKYGRQDRQIWGLAETVATNMKYGLCKIQTNIYILFLQICSFLFIIIHFSYRMLLLQSFEFVASNCLEIGDLVKQQQQYEQLWFN